MRIDEIMAEVEKYCKFRGIPITRGKLPTKYEHDIADFLDALKKTYKSKKAEKRKAPKHIGSVLRQIYGEAYGG